MIVLAGSLGVASSLVRMQCHVLVWHRFLGVSSISLGLGLFGPVRLGLVQLERVLLVGLRRLGLLEWLGGLQAACPEACRRATGSSCPCAAIVGHKPIGSAALSSSLSL